MTNTELLAAIATYTPTHPKTCALAARGHSEAIRILAAKVSGEVLGFDPLPIDWCKALASNLWAASVQAEIMRQHAAKVRS